MSENQHAHFRAILMEWRRELMEEVDRTVSHLKDEAANYPDPSDRASQEEEFSLELRTRTGSESSFVKLKKPLSSSITMTTGFVKRVASKSAYEGWRRDPQLLSVSTAKRWQS